jgi:hypothetical protein
MDLDFKTFSTIIVAIFGWWVGHYLSQVKDRKNKKRDIRTEYLKNTYRDLNKLRSYSQTLNIDEVGELLVRILGDIELYGTEAQIDLVRMMANEIPNEGKITSISSLIDNLRDDLRKELLLGKIPGQVSMFLVNASHNKTPQPTQKPRG